jgi:hypothetical protein
VSSPSLLYIYIRFSDYLVLLLSHALGYRTFSTTLRASCGPQQATWQHLGHIWGTTTARPGVLSWQEDSREVVDNCFVELYSRIISGFTSFALRSLWQLLKWLSSSILHDSSLWQSGTELHCLEKIGNHQHCLLVHGNLLHRWYECKNAAKCLPKSGECPLWADLCHTLLNANHFYKNAVKTQKHDSGGWYTVPNVELTKKVKFTKFLQNHTYDEVQFLYKFIAVGNKE